MYSYGFRIVTARITNVKTTTTILVILTIGLASLVLVTTTPAFAGTQIYSAQLSGDQEVPPVQTTDATGSADFRIPLSAISTPQAAIDYTVNGTGLENVVTAAHIHMGKMGENGDIVVTLCKAETCSAGGGGSGGGTLSLTGTFNATNLEGPMAGKQIEDLANEMTNGGTYVNVHT
ncbi:MAG TPA: CHRD domain-containing protein [Nitrososphaeraceae archaeon]|nr:CHRD domain-containing protein [Nitrososphaeraceae archaeon]